MRIRIPPVMVRGVTPGLAILFSLVSFAGRAHAAFNVIAANLTGQNESAVAWADYDNDGDQDLVIAGNSGASFLTRIYRSTGGAQKTYTDIVANLPGVHFGAVGWADYDQDGDLDLLVAGDTGSGFIARIYRSSGGFNPTFTDAAVGLPGVTTAALAWADYDADGDLDLLLAGNTGSGSITRIYRNSGGSNPTFTDISAGLPGVASGAVAWADFDNDGDLDLLLSGQGASARITRVYRSSGGANPVFADAAAGLPGLTESVAAWVDYDQDGDLDLLLSGLDGLNIVTGLYRSSGGSSPVFSDAGLGLPAVHAGAAAFGDFDGDLDPDLLLTGDTGGNYITQVLENSGGADPSFNDIGAGLPGVFLSAVAWADHDNDGDLDFVITGATGVTRMAQVYRNDGGALPPFAEVDAGLPGLSRCSAAWGDFDGDVDLDVVLAGDSDTGPIARIYRSSGGANPSFTDLAAGLTGVRAASVAWGDLDSDGDLDLAVAGDTGAGFITRIYRNNGGANPTFSDLAAGLPGVASGSVAWGDCDNDGDLDIVIAGDAASGRLARIYRNSGGPTPTFVDMAAGLPGVLDAAAAWADYDRDGDLDLLLTGATTSGSIARVYRNDGAANPTFTDVGAALSAVSQGAVAWGDYDNDGDLDLFLAGSTGAGQLSRLYRNGGGANPAFSNSGAAITSVRQGSAAWADYDDDGDLDLLVMGSTGIGPMFALYLNGGGSNPVFAQVTGVMPAVSTSTVAWGDYDNDSDLDVLLAGDTGSGRLTRIERNDGVPANTPPTAPGGLSTVVNPTAAVFSWSFAVDAQTPPAGLHYNLRIGSSSNALDILSPMADLATGRRRVVALAAFQGMTTSRPLSSISTNQFWSVQAVDGAFAGGPFSVEQKLVVAGEITSATDIPNDQGSWLYLAFNRSLFDDASASVPVTSYGVWRRVPGLSVSLTTEIPTAEATFPPGDWAFVANVPALQHASYLAAVPTISNAAPNDFLLTASTTTPSRWLISSIVSGQSIDNLAPAQPNAFAGTYSSSTAHLTWGANAENDLGGYRLYRGAAANFTPAPENLVATVNATHYDDASAPPGAYFKLAAFDVNGNASAYAAAQVGAGVGVEGDASLALTLVAVRPNPVIGDRLEVTFALPSANPARLLLVDLGGRLVADQEVGSRGPGWHTVDLTAGRRLVPGLYWLRLAQGSGLRSTRVTVLGF